MLSISKIICWAAMTDLVFASATGVVPLSVIRRLGVRRMNLRVDAREGAVKLTLPRFAPLGPALRWVEEKRGWVEAQLERMPQPRPIMPGMLVPFGDRQLRLDWQPSHPRKPQIVGETIRIGGPAEGLEARTLRWLRQAALARLREETEQIAARGGIIVPSVAVGDPKSRWGSCSSSGAIRYSWRLHLAPAFVLKATVAHEVAHRVHMNHGPAFHALVAELLGADPKPARHWLRTHGQSLHGFGRAY